MPEISIRQTSSSARPISITGGSFPTWFVATSYQAGTLTGETTISVAGGQIVESWTIWNGPEVLKEIGIFQ